MNDKAKIQNNGDWACPKCEAINSEHKDNIKKINNVLCNSCYNEFELDKEENQKNENEEKLKQANKNIEILITEIIELRAYKDSAYCAYPQEKDDDDNFCNNNCDECKDKFYENMKEELLKEYQV